MEEFRANFTKQRQNLWMYVWGLIILLPCPLEFFHGKYRFYWLYYRNMEPMISDEMFFLGGIGLLFIIGMICLFLSHLRRRTKLILIPLTLAFQLMTSWFGAFLYFRFTLRLDY